MVPMSRIRKVSSRIDISLMPAPAVQVNLGLSVSMRQGFQAKLKAKFTNHFESARVKVTWKTKQKKKRKKNRRKVSDLRKARRINVLLVTASNLSKI